MRSRSWIAITLVAGMTWCGSLGGVEPEFRRGDVGNNGNVSIGDAITLLGYLFVGETIDCRDAGDVDDNGTLNLSDPIQLLSYLFNGGSPPPAPGPLTCGPDPTLDAIECLTPPCGGADPARLEAGHLLARASFGARLGDVDAVIASGIPAWVDSQIAGIDESANTALNARVDTLTLTFDRTIDTEILKENTRFRYLKGNAPYPGGWQLPTFDDSAWLEAPSPLRYSFNNTGGTQLLDMQGGYTSVAIRGSFFVPDPLAVPAIALRADFDDGFVAWVNGVEVGRRNVNATNPANTVTATANHGPGIAEYYEFPTSLLVPGENVLAVIGVNRTLNNGDFYLEPRIVVQAPTADPPRTMMSSRESLQRFAFFRGTYSENALESVLSMFWDNHFTTDYDKVKDYVQSKRNRYNRPTIFAQQAQLEAANLEWEEHRFFIDNAFGNFGDLLLYSATSPTMLIYLDSVLNDAAEPNENYAREILELFGLGVDNGYTQADVEEVARCFTGWSVEKIPYTDVLPFPDRAITPIIDTPTDTIDTDLIAVGDTWSYWKGTAEPSPGAGGVPTLSWTEVGFDDATWLSGPTGIGFGDGDDATVLNDMQGNYTSVYLRKSFDVTDVNEPGNLELEVFYDDGVVVYLNGNPITRSGTLANAGSPPPFNATSNGHEVTAAPIRIGLDPFRPLLNVGENVLAIQVHNSALGNNDLSCIPRLFSWLPGPGYLDPEDRQGHWHFRFDPDNHDTGPKTIFAGTPYELQIPAGRLGAAGVQDGIDVIDRIAEHPATAEFIGVKLIGLLVSDQIDLASAHDLSAPIELRALLASVIATWNSTTPPGNIEQIVRTILSANDLAGTFWSDLARRAKVKTPFEHMVSTLRALEAEINGRNLTARMSAMGQHFFDRDEPDGWPERGDQWIGTTSLLERVNFIRELAENATNAFGWDPLPFIQASGAVSAADIIDLFDELLYQGTLNGSERLLLLRYAEVQTDGSILPLDPAAGDYEARVEQLVGMILSMPRWCFQ